VTKGVVLLDRIEILESSVVVVGAGILVVHEDRILHEIEGRGESVSRPESAGKRDGVEIVVVPVDPAVALAEPAGLAAPVPATVVAAVVQRVVLAVPEEFDVLVVGFVVPSSSRSCIGCC